MVTKHIIPCSICGKPVERYIYCSGACKVAGYRQKNHKKVIEEALPEVTKSYKVKKIDESAWVKAKDIPDMIGLCKHGSMKGLCKFGC